MIQKPGQFELGTTGRMLIAVGLVALNGCASGLNTLSDPDAKLERKIAERVKNDPFPSANMSTGVVKKK